MSDEFDDDDNETDEHHDPHCICYLEGIDTARERIAKLEKVLVAAKLVGTRLQASGMQVHVSLDNVLFFGACANLRDAVTAVTHEAAGSDE